MYNAALMTHSWLRWAVLVFGLLAIARALAGQMGGRPWSRADEHGWEPESPAMSVRLAAGLDDGDRITSWQHDTFSYPHGARPRPTGSSRVSGLLATWSFDPPAGLPEPSPPSGFHSGAHRNAAQTAAKLRAALKRHLSELVELTPAELLERRYQKFRKLGSFVEQPA